MPFRMVSRKEFLFNRIEIVTALFTLMSAEQFRLQRGHGPGIPLPNMLLFRRSPPHPAQDPRFRKETATRARKQQDTSHCPM